MQGYSPAHLLGARLTLMRIHCKLKEETLDGALWRTPFRTGCGPVATQDDAMNENTRTVRGDVTCDVEEVRESYEKCKLSASHSRVNNGSSFIFRIFCRVEW